MRIVQIIDSLETGGAERMAVNYANALSEKIEFSGLIVSRKEGSLLNQIGKKVSYLFLEKNKRIDLKAILRLRKYLKSNKIDVIHAHSSSFFIAILGKLTMPKVKIVWHDHYGSRATETKKENKVLIFLSIFFSAIFVVNHQLEDWSRKNMKCPRVIFIPNFVISGKKNEQITKLKGTAGKRIIFLANLKKPKNHILILKAFQYLKLNELGWSLHLVGKDYFDSYSDILKRFIESNFLQDYIHLYGEKSDVKYILSQASIGVLASTDEGFPVTLIEYALANLAVLSTNVGYCGLLIVNNSTGMLFNPLSDLEVSNHLIRLVNDKKLREEFGKSYKQFILDNYTETIIIEKLIAEYQKIS
ncbi:glycosyltransferase [Flavobacterium sp. CSZ]|uniref:glycosyltransferase n=1 Tax=Flavobacterium sp. CSZ TaxID=2783791 RepID=UPI00188A1F59|nr:glycosyltransferase [Flavobacterium sp. CSZ]MBF4486034.1 glycosyltransferase [Flavobacterium sp. CSZ]